MNKYEYIKHMKNANRKIRKKQEQRKYKVYTESPADRAFRIEKVKYKR